MVSNPVVIIIFKERDFVAPSSIKDGYMVESGIRISLLKPVNARTQFPVIFFHLKNIVIIFYETNFMILEIVTGMVV